MTFNSALFSLGQSRNFMEKETKLFIRTWSFFLLLWKFTFFTKFKVITRFYFVMVIFRFKFFSHDEWKKKQTKSRCFLVNNEREDFNEKIVKRFGIRNSCLKRKLFRNFCNRLKVYGGVINSINSWISSLLTFVCSFPFHPLCKKTGW